VVVKWSHTHAGKSKWRAQVTLIKMMTRSSWQWTRIAVLVSSTTATALSPTYNVVFMVMDDARPAQRYAYVRVPPPSPSTAFTLLGQLAPICWPGQ
jgi:hypothetical protein